MNLVSLSKDSPMLARLGNLLGKLFGNILFWIGWALAVVVLAQAIILSLATGSPAIPVILGLVGIALWLIGMGFRYILARR
jgi:hypothetical protein